MGSLDVAARAEPIVEGSIQAAYPGRKVILLSRRHSPAWLCHAGHMWSGLSCLTLAANPLPYRSEGLCDTPRRGCMQCCNHTLQHSDAGKSLTLVGRQCLLVFAP